MLMPRVRKEVVTALRLTWEYVAEDCLKLAAGEIMTSKEVREVAADAHFGMLQPEACKIFRELERKEKDSILVEAFPDGLHGY